MVTTRRSRGPFTEEDYRDLHETHGLPRDLIDEILGDAVERDPARTARV